MGVSIKRIKNNYLQLLKSNEEYYHYTAKINIFFSHSTFGKSRRDKISCVIIERSLIKKPCLKISKMFKSIRLKAIPARKRLISAFCFLCYRGSG